MFRENIDDITTGIEFNITKALHSSISSNNKDMFFELARFCYHVMATSIANDSINKFNTYVNFPGRYFVIAHDKKKTNNLLIPLYKTCTERAAGQLQEIIQYHLRYQKVSTLKEKKRRNEFYYSAFLGFNFLLYNIIDKRDLEAFQKAIEEFDQLSMGYNGGSYEMEFKLRELKRNNANGDNKNAIQELEDALNVEGAYHAYFRHVKLGIKFWLYYLYDLNLLTEEELNGFLKEIEMPYISNDDFLRDILLFRGSRALSYLGWSEWDYMERPNGKIYSPPDPYYWLAFGLVIEMIANDRYILNLNDIEDPSTLNSIENLYDNFKEKTQYINQHFDKWKNVLKVNTQEELSRKIDQLTNQFKLIKRKSIGERERQIAAAPLSQNNITNFKKIIGDAWKQNARVHHLYRKYDNFQTIADEGIKLKVIGQRTFFEKAKMMFVEGEHYQHIYGIESYGSRIGRWEDNEFFNTILKYDYRLKKYESLTEAVEGGIDEIRKTEKEPNLIIMPPEFSYRDKEFTENKKFVSRWQMQEQQADDKLFDIGKFDTVPVFSSLSSFIKDKVIVCRFEDAFEMRNRKNNEWYDEVLTVNVLPVTEEEAREKLNANRQKWMTDADGNLLSEEDALTLIRTSVVIEVWLQEDFLVKDPNSFIICQINKLPED